MNQFEWEQWDVAPQDTIAEADFDDWIAQYQRRVWRTPFPGRTGNRNRSILLSLTAVMAEQRERVITITYPGLVRVCAADHKTVVDGVRDLRKAGHLLCVGSGPLVQVRQNEKRSTAHLYKFALVDSQLVADEDAAPLPETILPRSANGDLAHDAFGGKRGIKRSDIAVLQWLAEHPGATRYEVGKAGIVSQATAYRVIERLEQHGLITIGDDGRCFMVDGRTEESLLTTVVQENCLYGQAERRVDNAIYPFELGKHYIRKRENPNKGRAGHWGMPR